MPHGSALPAAPERPGATLGRRLRGAAERGERVTLEVGGERHELPVGLLDLVARVLDLPDGDPERVEVTPNRAAPILGLSRPLVVRRIASGDLPARKVGAHHRIRLDDLLAFKERLDDEARANRERLRLEAALGLDDG